MIRRPPRSTRVRSSAASDVYKRQVCPPIGSVAQFRDGSGVTATAWLTVHSSQLTVLYESPYNVTYRDFLDSRPLSRPREFGCSVNLAMRGFCDTSHRGDRFRPTKPGGCATTAIERVAMLGTNPLGSLALACSPKGEQTMNPTTVRPG